MLVTPLLIRALALGERFNANADVKASVWPRLGAEEEHMGQAPKEQPEDRPLAEPHLILQPGSFYSTDGTVPLGIQVSGEAAGLVLEIRSLPTGMSISSGRPIGDRWRLVATDLGEAMIRPPQGFSATAELAVELRSDDDTIVDSALSRLEWLRTPTFELVPSETPSAVAISDSTQGSATLARTDANAVSQPDNGQIEFLFGRSQERIPVLDAGLVGTAKAGAFRLAAVLSDSNEPLMLATLQDRGASAEGSSARDGYKNAGEFDSRQIQKQLFLGRTPIESSHAVFVSDNARQKAIPTPAAKPKGRVVRMPSEPMARPQDRYEAHVDGSGADPNPPPLPPAFLR
jgi:hypothetical protein